MKRLQGGFMVLGFLELKAYLGIQKPTVLGVRPSNEGVRT